jgi:hypothetical protein
MSKLCPKCDLGSDDNAAFCRWCGGDLRAVEGSGGPPATDVPSTGSLPPPPPSSDFPWPPVSGVQSPPAPGLPPPVVSGLPPPVGSGFPSPPAPGSPPGFGGAPGYGLGNLPGIPNHLVWAILSTILCCLPLGVVSIVYAAQVNTHVLRGDISTAQRSSKLARNWAIASIVVSAVSWILYGIAVAVGAREALGRLHS